MSAVTRSGRLYSRLGANSLGGGGVDLDFLFEILFLARGHHLLSCRLSPVPVWASPAGFPVVCWNGSVPQGLGLVLFLLAVFGCSSQS